MFVPEILRGAGPKWGKMNDLSAPLHVGEEDIVRILNVRNIEHLLYEVFYLNKFIEEEFLLKEAALFGLESSRVIEDIKKSIAFKTII
ncbi:hypothetical protein IEQ34_017191 [Dendrobium chrysotoxum]|uniref:Uncharacterized protein n=1 Tax=Dendrobium chrysotoxum TaxID=161865 RepID=A0AAV7GBC2_DENCH|nr:hypothetical protein IEQ34_017191 [Dendrobium chrysotoxum]